MHPDLSKALLNILSDEGQVTLPGFGTFRLQAQPATVSTIEGRTRPPAKKVQFNGNLKLDDGRLVRYLTEFPADDQLGPEAGIADFIAKLNAEIDAGKMVTLDGIGRLFRDHTGDIRFTAGDHNLDKESFGLPDVSLTPIIRTERAPAAASIATSSVKKITPQPATLREMQDEPEPMTVIWGFIRENIWAIALVTLIICVFGMAYVRYRDGDSTLDTMERQAPPPPNDRVNVPPPPTPENEIPPADDQVNQENSPAVINQAPPTNNLPPEEGIAVIGLYRLGSEANVRKNVKRISEAGYEPFTRRSDRLTRVGIQVRYRNEQELNKILSAIRREFTTDAFILEKDGERFQQ